MELQRLSPMPAAGAEGVIPEREPIIKYFAFEHLPDKLKAISEPFCLLAEHVHVTLPRGPERSVALRKLLEAKDAAVRAAL